MNDYLEFLALFGVGGAHPGGLQLSKQLLKHEGLTNSTKILDIGCGTGQTAAHLVSKYKCNITAIDIHPLMIEKAKMRLNNLGYKVDLLVANAEKLPYEDSSFDYVLSESVLSFTDSKKALKEISRVLKKGGVLLAIEMTNEGNLTSAEKEEIKTFYGVNEIYNEVEWKNLMYHSGFGIVTIDSIDLSTEGTEEFHGIEFHLSPEINQYYLTILDRHELLTQKYKNKLGFRIYKCRK
ncbi:class I SAM-dependent methyltransferase [Bacillus sp. PS06]|uniref:class I SAM-dependent methyltransferase n=1 Tax=Bacillus sp. PS06 TaxID=2764176 RepID=UPI00177D5B85|nr:class I SAM-dependent methyltransferase [Bacillus sp. PS06]MBD8068030.1 class I SAM-dependent methyltransferase [Bacillus sp. PS06]